MRTTNMRWLATDCARDAVAGSVLGARIWRRVRPVSLQFRRPRLEPATKTPAAPSSEGATTHHHWNLDLTLQMLARHAQSSKSVDESHGRLAREFPAAEKPKLVWSARRQDAGQIHAADRPAVMRDDLPLMRLETHSAIERAVDKILRIDRHRITAEFRFLERGERIREHSDSVSQHPSDTMPAGHRAPWRRPVSTMHRSIAPRAARPSRGPAAQDHALQPRPVTLAHVIKVDQNLRSTTTSRRRYRQVLPVEIVYQQLTRSAPATAPRSGAAVPQSPRLEPLDVKSVSREVLRRIDKQIRVQRERSGRL